MSINLAPLLTALGNVEDDIRTNIDKVTAEYEAAKAAAEAEGKAPPSMDPTVLLGLQLDVGQYQQLSGITTAIISDVKQSAQGIVQKM